MDKEVFTFDKFYKIYQTICPRTDIDSLFTSMCETKDTSPFVDNLRALFST